MKTEIEIIRTDEKNQLAQIIGLRNNKVIVYNKTLSKEQEYDLEDLKQFIKFI